MSYSFYDVEAQKKIMPFSEIEEVNRINGEYDVELTHHLEKYKLKKQEASMIEKLENRLLNTYKQTLSTQGVNGSRLAKRLGELSEIGQLPSGGVSRYGYGEKEQAAHDLAKLWLEEAGAEVEIDAAGNTIGHIKGQSSAKTFASGSHLDTVPNGGNFDGTAGVLIAIEVAQAWKAMDYTPPFNYDIIIFREEEGSQFNMGVLGSSAFMGLLKKAAFSDLKATNTGLSFSSTLEHNHLSVASFFDAKKHRNYELYIEAHIEQGKVLENAEQAVGVVSGIAGLADLNFTFTGISDHAGNTPMDDRFDPLVTAGRFVYELSLLPETISDSAVATVGKMNVYPNGANVIAEKVDVTVDVRDVDLKDRQALEHKIIDCATTLAKENKISVDYTKTTDVQPVTMDEELQTDLKQIIKEVTQKETLTLPSGAGHDAMNLAKESPVAMVFIKSHKGISHHPAEWSDLSDIVTGVHVVKQFLEKKMNA